jgi:hypothetical protein
MTSAMTRLAQPDSIIAARRSRLFLALLSLFVAACTLLSPYDPTSYKNATDIKTESLSLLERATEPFANHVAEVDLLRLHLRQAYEYERNKGKPNEETVAQWRLLKDESGHLVGGTLAKWKASGALGETFLAEVSTQIEKGFDEIIALEQGKAKK